MVAEAKPHRYSTALLCAIFGLLTGGSAQGSPLYSVFTYQHPGAQQTGFRDINAAGDVVGYFQDDPTSPATAHALGIIDGVVRTVDPPGSTGDRRAFGINDAGDIAGSFDAGGLHGFIRDAASTLYSTVDVPGTLQGTTIRALNNHGDIAGEFDDTAGMTRGFVRRADVFSTIHVPGATLTAVRAIDDTGRIAGYYADAIGQLHGFFSDDAVGFTVLDRPGAFSTLIGGIGIDGSLVGVTLDSPGTPDSVPARGFIYRHGMFVDFSIDDAVSTIPLAINARGQVAGEYIDGRGRHFGFVATPVSEPPFLAAIVLGFLLLRRR